MAVSATPHPQTDPKRQPKDGSVIAAQKRSDVETLASGCYFSGHVNQWRTIEGANLG